MYFFFLKELSNGIKYFCAKILHHLCCSLYCKAFVYSSFNLIKYEVQMRYAFMDNVQIVQQISLVWY